MHKRVGILAKTNFMRSLEKRLRRGCPRSGTASGGGSGRMSPSSPWSARSSASRELALASDRLQVSGTMLAVCSLVGTDI